MNRLPVWISVTAATLSCSGLSGQSREANPAPCPNVVVLEDAARLVDFDGAMTADNVAYSAEITGVRSSCRYFADKPVVAALDVDFSFGSGPAAPDDTRTYRYFVAVTRPDMEVIAKREFDIPVRFTRGRRIVSGHDRIDRIVIPRAGENTSGENFEIVVGFSLTPRQVLFNRSGKSLKFPDMQ